MSLVNRKIPVQSRQGLHYVKVVVDTILPVQGYCGWCVTLWGWQKDQYGSPTGGPSIRGSARWGQVLNVEEAYLSSSQVLMWLLFSGVHSNGRELGCVAVTER